MKYNQLMGILRDRAKLGACENPQIFVEEMTDDWTKVKVTIPLTGELPARPKSRYNDPYQTVYYANTWAGSSSYTSTTGGWY